METISLENLANLSPELYVLSAEERYKDFVKSIGNIPGLDNPNAISEETFHKKELFSKLKFQYLEQETREKFLRGILDTPPSYVDQNDIEKKIISNKEIKNELKSLKIELIQVEQTCNELAREVISLQEEFEERARATEAMLIEMEDMGKELVDLAHENPVINQVISLQSGEDFNDISTTLQQIRNDQEQNLLRLNNEYGLKEGRTISDERTINRLNEKLKDLEKSIEGNNDIQSQDINDSKLTKDQIFGQWVKEMNDIWSKFFINIKEINVANEKDIKVIEILFNDIEDKVTLRIDYLNDLQCNILQIRSNNGVDYSKIEKQIECYKGIEKVGKFIEIIGNK